MNATSTLQIALVAGIAGGAAAGTNPTTLEPSVAQIKHGAHIYFNIATGDKIATLIENGDSQSPVDGTPGTEIWIADSGQQCLDFGYSTSYYYALDNPTGTTSLSINAMMFDWGDIAMDTVVDCVQIHWITNHADTDTDSDSIADGIEGFMGTWTYWDGMNGRAPQMDSTALPIIQIGFYGLQGEPPLGDPNDEFVWFYTANIDLGTTFGTSLTFEIGDTDSDLQGAAIHNARMDLNDADSDSIPDIDHDQDGLADWGWSIQYNQPGTIDVDNADSDSDTQTGIDGDIAALATAGVSFGSPTPGHPEFDSIGGGWDWVSDGPTAGATEDAFTLGTTSLPTGGVITIAGTFWFGGLDCSAGQTNGYSAASHFRTTLFGAVACAPDLNGDGALDFFDVSFFLANSVDYDGNTVFDFFDVSGFLGDFGIGCP